MELPFLSIIIPYYNTPINYLLRAVNSIKCNDASFVEIIIVDDGSELNNARQLDKELQFFPNVTVYHKENGGLSSARNFGIDKSFGEYIAFLDDDDEISAHFCRESYEYSQENNYDVIIGNIITIPYENTTTNHRKYEFDEKDKNELYQCLVGVEPRRNDCMISGSVCGKIYKSSLVKKIYFNEEVSILEDQLFNRVLFQYAKKTLVVPETWYKYYQRDGSIMHPQKREDIYNKYLSYISGIGQIMPTVSEDVKIMYSCEIFRLFDFYAADLVKSNIRILQGIKKLKKWYEIPIVKDSVNMQHENGIYLNSKKKILVFLMKYRLYIPYWILKKVAFLYNG